MNADEYEVMYRVEDRHWWYGGLRRMVLGAWTRYGAGKGARVLDMGCGTGANMALLADAAEVTGVDLSPLAVGKCRQRGLDATALGSVEAVPFGDELFDGVVMMDVLYHRGVRDKARPLEEAYRVLKPGGLLMVNVPAYDWLTSSHDAAIHTDHRFGRGEIAGLVRGASFEPLLATYWNTVLFAPIVLVRLWRRGTADRGSDLESEPGGLSSLICSGALALERAAMHLFPLPFGLSIFVVARK